MGFGFSLIFLLLFECLLPPLIAGDEEITLDMVKLWTDNIGTKLWEIGNEVTKLENINKRYSDMKASVEKTDGEEILQTIATRMNKLVKEKVDAVLRIKNAAMRAERNVITFNDSDERTKVEYHSSKFSSYSIPEEFNLDPREIKDKPDDLNYTDMTLFPHPHFKDVLVNINHSSVHVPTNIFDRWDNVITPIMWSQAIDDIFISNYQTDPSLMWQYYASTSGFLRHYPAFHWSMEPDKYDCRRRIWYIQAATCSKEVVILIDNSGTMYGMRNTIAQLTVDYLLQTFSNNDYISIFRLTEEKVTGLVKCFEDTLIQATPENIVLFKNALYRMCPEKKINFTVGFRKAFKILHDFMKNKTENTERRNQAVFLLTDLLLSSSELEKIKNEYEEVYNDTNIQVELFLYFIGKDITDVREMQWEKCLRNGSIVHVRTMDEAPEDALKYLSVIARTQNESTQFYPVSWTHTFFDIDRDKGIERQTNEVNDINDMSDIGDPIVQNEEVKDTTYGSVLKPQIMTSVTTPVYASKASDKEGSEKSTNNNKKEELIGVAAIDVPISDFKKLTMPHKIGVNGYAFVVTNNGYVLFHPDLRPVVDNTYRENFNSVDLSEVEFYDDDSTEPRAEQKQILELRELMVNQKQGMLSDMSIKFHYHDQKRVGTEYRNYYYTKLECSPFSLGLALPRGYGNYWVKTTNEIENTKGNTAEEGGDYLKYFQGDWTIHPEWSYCDFRNNTKYDTVYLKDRRKKLLHFLDHIFNDKDFEWVEEHVGDTESNTSGMNQTEYAEYCFGEKAAERLFPPKVKDYFCDKELMELLFFDAKLTAAEFNDTQTDNLAYMEKNKISLKFVATQGGLTRWKNFQHSPEKSFGERNGTALDEVWYKSAVLLHQPDSQNFVLSVPQNHQYGGVTQKYITASYAIFYHEGGHEAPGVVVGFQFAYDTLKRIAEDEFGRTCDKDSNWDCYIIDANGYIIYSRYDHEIGKFFGTINGGGALMVDMVENGLYRNITMFDYQGLKDDNIRKDPFTVGASSTLINPVKFVVWSLNWILSNILWFLIESNLWQFVNAGSSCSSVTSLKNTTTCLTCRLENNPNKTCPICCKAPKQYEDTCQTREVLPHVERLGLAAQRPRKIPVDRRSFLYLYANRSIDGYSSAENSRPFDQCSRPYFLKRIKYTNLNFLLVRSNHSTCYVHVDVEPSDIHYSTGEDGQIPACNKKMMNSYPRKKLLGCSDRVLPKRVKEACGSGNRIELTIFLTWSVLASSVLFAFF